MTGDDVISEYEPANDAERQTLEARWANGHLRRHVAHLLAFTDRHRGDIQRLAGDPLHAANWRRWRLKEYLFVADCCAAEIIDRLAAAESTASDQQRDLPDTVASDVCGTGCNSRLSCGPDS